jgi:succinate-semialdehyde dehydrogenase / glutarate-semialdehyde dehydrogenase
MTSTGTDRTTAAGRLDAGYLTGLAARVTAAPGRPRQTSSAPFDGSPVGEVPTCTAEDVRTAQDRARRAQAEWAQRPLADRCRVVLRFSDLVVQHLEHLVDVLQVETGKARISAFEEVADVALTARYSARAAARHLRPGRRRGALPGLTRPVVHQRPKGLVGVISPWDAPMTLTVSDAVPALLAGNAVVLKPDAQTPFSALAVVALLVDAGLPPDLFGVVTGRGSVLGTPLVEGVDHLTFTGSTATGRLVAE